jgi:hypothetical protein
MMVVRVFDRANGQSAPVKLSHQLNDQRRLAVVLPTDDMQSFQHV